MYFGETYLSPILPDYFPVIIQTFEKAPKLFQGTIT